MHYVVTMYAALAALCWCVVALGAAVAVISPRINDTLSERFALSVVSIGAAGTAWRVMRSGEITDGGLWIALALAGYVAALFWKHAHHLDGGSTDKGTKA